MIKEIKNETVVLIKGFEWNAKPKTLDFWTALLIQLSTLSRFTHNYLILKYENQYFKYETIFPRGMHLTKLNDDDIKQIISDANNNKIDLRMKKNYGSEHSKYIQDKMKVMIEEDIDTLQLGTYNLKGVIDYGLWKIFRKEIKDVTDYENMFCSELIYYYFTDQLWSNKIAPVDIALNDDTFITII